MSLPLIALLSTLGLCLGEESIANAYPDYGQSQYPATDLQYSPSEVYYPQTGNHHQQLGPVPVGLAVAAAIGAAIVGAFLTLSAADARNTLKNDVRSSETTTNNLSTQLATQSSLLTAINNAQTPATDQLTKLCSATAAVGALTPLAPAAVFGDGMTKLDEIIAALNANACL